jgi:ribosome biogenesis GTPase A
MKELDTILGEKKWVLTQDPLKSEYQDEVWIPKKLQQNDISEVDKKIRSERKKTSSSSAHSTHLHHSPLQNDLLLSKMKGFLQLNPHICSGCGSHFQSKTPDHPGYLEKDRFTEHRHKAEKLRKIQEALKILDLAGINPDSDVAMELLVKANVPSEIIEGVIEINHRVTRGQKKFSFDDLSSPFPSPSSPDQTNNEHKTTSGSREKIPQDPRRVLGYHHSTLEPIYDEQTLLKSYLEEKSLSSPSSASSASSYPSKKPTPITSTSTTTEDDADSSTIQYASDALPICQRCFRLQFYGQCEDTLRPGWTTNQDLIPTKFENLLKIIQDQSCVVLCLVDIFDLEGSIVPNLKEIAGKNPIVIVANKIDLLPNDVSLKRVTDWIHRSVRQRCNLMTPQEAEDLHYKEYKDKGWSRDVTSKNSHEGILRKQNIHLISCTKGSGLQELMNHLLTLSTAHGDKIYVMGTANVGKSSFINRLLKYTSTFTKSSSSRLDIKKKKQSLPQATVSSLPGTTLDFLKIRLPNGVQMIDTPGLINRQQLTSRLNTTELKMVIPNQQIHHVTLSVQEKYCVLIGGLAKIEVVEVSDQHN